MSNQNYDLLIQKLDAFIRKYYKNQLIKGGVYFVIGGIILFLLVSALEYFGHYNQLIRAILFYLFVLGTAFLAGKYVAIPLTRLFRIGKILGYAEASVLIGKHFPEVKDKLLNTLELKQKADGLLDASLIEAAIAQKTKQLHPVPFVAAIDLRKNLRYLRYALLPVIACILIYLIAPGMISDGTMRVLRYNQTFIEPPPFAFYPVNEFLEAEQFSDFELEVEVKGKELPEEVFVVREGNAFKMQKTDPTHFVFVFNSVREKFSFELEAADYTSKAYSVEVISKPQIMKYSVRLDYPSYLNRAHETIQNPGDLTVPAGTVINWNFVTRKTDEVWLGFNEKTSSAKPNGTDVFTYSRKLFQSASLFIQTKNKEGKLKDSLHYMLGVIPDAFPTITVEEKEDSLNREQKYFIGDIADDYGLTRLTFNYRLLKKDAEETDKPELQVKDLAIDGKDKTYRFYHQILLQETGMQPSDEVEYYFEVWDNDGVFGHKSVKSKLFNYKAPSEKELEAKSEADKSSMKQNMEEAIKEAKTMQKELKDLEQKMLEKRELTWEEKKKLEKLMERQKELAEKVEAIKQEQKRVSAEEREHKKQSEEILRKQEQIDKMFNEIMNEEMKKLIKQMEQMMQMQNKEQIKQEMEKLELSNKDIEKELDKMLEHFKALEVEKKLEEALDKLQKLEEKQDALSKKTEKLDQDIKLNNADKKELVKKLQDEQKELSEQFKEVEKQIQDATDKNSKLEEPKKLEDTKEEQKGIEEDQKQSEEELENNEPEKSAKEQKEAKDKMKKMADKMKKSMEEAEEKELEINAEALREILENTIQLSNDEEKLMQDFKYVSNYNPQYVAAAKTQKDIRENARIIEDSLLALSKKVPEISSFINREVSKLTDNLEKSVEGFGTRNIEQIRTTQQRSMMHANNLGVMLSEVLKQMQDQMTSNSEGKSGKTKKPGKGKGKGKSMSSMKKMQEELNKQLREGLNKQEGKKPGDKPGGDKSGGKPGGMGSEDYARMAAQQMAIRQQMQKMLSEMGTKEKEGLGGNAKLQEMQKLMEQTEKELFNKRMSSEMLRRQEDIMTRMLESEKAEIKQEQDKKREAEQAKEKPRTPPPTFDEYLKKKKSEEELLQTIPTEMQPYYKEKTKTYFNKAAK